MFPLKVATWNLNGLRSRAAQLIEWLAEEKPDVFLCQEIRVTPEQIPMDLVELEGYHCLWHGGPKGYSGVGLHVAQHLGEVVYSHPKFDFESRVAQARVGDTVFISIYVPNGGKDYGGKINFVEALDAHLTDLAAQGLQVVLGGDINIARSDMDVHPKERKGTAIGQLNPERDLFERLLSRGYVDVQRSLHPDDENIFSWWAPWRDMRKRNIGWRIDYILASTALAARATSCVSQREVGTSDHAPVVAVFS